MISCDQANCPQYSAENENSPLRWTQLHSDFNTDVWRSAGSRCYFPTEEPSSPHFEWGSLGTVRFKFKILLVDSTYRPIGAMSPLLNIFESHEYVCYQDNVWGICYLDAENTGLNGFVDGLEALYHDSSIPPSMIITDWQTTLLKSRIRTDQLIICTWCVFKFYSPILIKSPWKHVPLHSHLGCCRFHEN